MILKGQCQAYFHWIFYFCYCYYYSFVILFIYLSTFFSPIRTGGKKIPLRKSDGSQMMIDAGQKEFGAKQCDVCGIIYEIGNPEDEASHEAHHNSFLNTLKYIVSCTIFLYHF